MNTDSPGLPSQSATRSAHRSVPGYGLKIHLGTELDTGKDAFWDPSTSTPRRLSNQHMLLVGKSGSGKSNTQKSFIWELDRRGVPVIILDYDGEYGRGGFAEAVKPRVFDVMDGLPINPFELPVSPQTGRPNLFEGTYELASLLNLIFSGSGEIQLGLLREAIRESYEQVGIRQDAKSTWTKEPPTVGTLKDVLNTMGEGKGKKKGDIQIRNLLVRLQPLFDSGIFGGKQPAFRFDDLLARTTVIRMTSGISELMAAATRFVLMKLYRTMIAKGESEHLRVMLCIDEAHKVCGDEAVTKLIKEARKYGLGIILASQETRDFHPSILANTGTIVALGLEDADASFMARNMGVTDPKEQQAAKKLILNQPTGHALVRSQHFLPYRRVKILAFHDRVHGSAPTISPTQPSTEGTASAPAHSTVGECDARFPALRAMTPERGTPAYLEAVAYDLTLTCYILTPVSILISAGSQSAQSLLPPIRAALQESTSSLLAGGHHYDLDRLMEILQEPHEPIPALRGHGPDLLVALEAPFADGEGPRRESLRMEKWKKLGSLCEGHPQLVEIDRLASSLLGYAEDLDGTRREVNLGGIAGFRQYFATGSDGTRRSAEIAARMFIVWHSCVMPGVPLRSPRERSKRWSRRTMELFMKGLPWEIAARRRAILKAIAQFACTHGLDLTEAVKRYEEAVCDTDDLATRIRSFWHLHDTVRSIVLRGGPPATVAVSSSRRCSCGLEHKKDFIEVGWPTQGKVYKLTERESAAFKVLHDALLSDEPDVPLDKLYKAAGSEATNRRLRDLFRTSGIVSDGLVTSGVRTGTVRLAPHPRGS